MITVNFFVTNQMAPDHSEYTCIESGLDFEALFANLDELLRVGRLRVTTGPLGAPIVVKLPDDLDHDEYKAVLGPLEEGDGEERAGCLQAYFTLKTVS